MAEPFGIAQLSDELRTELKNHTQQEVESSESRMNDAMQRMRQSILDHDRVSKALTLLSRQEELNRKRNSVYADIRKTEDRMTDIQIYKVIPDISRPTFATLIIVFLLEFCFQTGFDLWLSMGIGAACAIAVGLITCIAIDVEHQIEMRKLKKEDRRLHKELNDLDNEYSKNHADPDFQYIYQHGCEDIMRERPIRDILEIMDGGEHITLEEALAEYGQETE
jgi:hypothetical protein